MALDQDRHHHHRLGDADTSLTANDDPGVADTDTASSPDPAVDAATVVTPPPINGVDYVADVYGSYAAASSLSSLPSVNVNAVALTADFGIDAVDSAVYQNDVDGGYTESDANVAATITAATNLGLSVMVRPLIDFLPDNYDTDPDQTRNNPLNGSYSPGEFRSYYMPTNVADFFASYQSMIVREATLAQTNGATLFCIGTELDQLTGPAYETYWDNIISAVRAVFSGKLTYSADWDDALSPWQFAGLPVGTGNITTQISFWSKLDYVGIDEYAPISDAANPTPQQLINGWTQTPTDPVTLEVTGNQSLISYYQGIAATLGKPLLFTELGYANSSDAAASPATPGFDEDGNPDGAVADPTLQANLYQAFFDAWKQGGNGSLAGTYLWNWEPNAASVGPGNGINFSVQGQPAQSVVASGFAETACFCRGTLILTDGGDVPVEQLRAGDLVRTMTGEARPIRWIGRRRIDLARHPVPRLVQPIRIRANAFADNVPRRDLLVSPDHAIYLDGWLIPARLLCNGTTIGREERFRSVSYFHVELERHDIIMAEGSPTESYLDTGNRGMFENADVPLILHPDLGQARREAMSCAPFTADAAQVESVWRKLERRSRLLGYIPLTIAATADPALHVLAGGRTLSSAVVHNGCHVFVLPPRTASVRLRSRSAAPCDARPWLEDRRCLGVMVRRITLRSGNEDRALPLDHPLLRGGWWDTESDDDAVWRWTNGDALLPLDAPAALLLIEIGETMMYRTTTPAHVSMVPRMSGAGG